jgi:hypothetical protein
MRHVRVRAGDLVPHELNPRVHPEAQRRALQALYDKIGFARSLLAYPLPDGRLKLIDGHLRQSLDPDMEVDVEVLDVDDAEARTLLLSIDPLARLADYDAALTAELLRLTPPPDETLGQLWQTVTGARDAAERSLKEARERRPGSDESALPEQFLVLVECASEEEQVALLERFQREGLRCRALLS